MQPGPLLFMTLGDTFFVPSPSHCGGTQKRKQFTVALGHQAADREILETLGLLTLPYARVFYTSFQPFDWLM